jgi:hypothetical protein
MVLDMPFQDVEQCARLAGGRNFSQGPRQWLGGDRRPRLARLFQGAEKIADGIRFGNEIDR